MSDNNYAPPAAPPPAASPKNDSKLKLIAVSFFAISVLFLGIIIGADGDSNSTSNKTKDTAANVEPPAPADPVQNKYDTYYENVLNNSGIANSRSKSSVIETGDLVCQSLDEGNTVRAVAIVLEGASNTQSELEYAAAIMYWAITDLCPEYKRALDVYLGN